MGRDLQAIADEVREELEQRGASAVQVQGDLDIDRIGTTAGPQPMQQAATLEVDFDGTSEMLTNAVRSMDTVMVESYTMEDYPGGDVHVSGDLWVVEQVSPGATPGGNTARTTTQQGGGGNISPADPPTAPVDPPAENEATQDPHVAPGGTWAIEDENGIPDEYPVEVWPVRYWEPVPEVQALTVLRYVPDAAGALEWWDGLEWWAGYARLVPEGLTGGGTLQDDLLATLRAGGLHFQGHTVRISYEDPSGWCGWAATDFPVEVSGVPVYTDSNIEVAQLDHTEAGSLTEGLAQGVREVRRQVL